MELFASRGCFLQIIVIISCSYKGKFFSAGYEPGLPGSATAALYAMKAVCNLGGVNISN